VSERLAAILREHRGRANAITSDELADRLGWDDGNGNPETRFAIRDLVEQTGLPVASCPQGYFVVETRRELKEYIGDLEQRKKGITARQEAVLEAFDEDADPQQTLGDVGEVEI
jgi:hypothetical protein